MRFQLQAISLRDPVEQQIVDDDGTAGRSMLSS